MIVLAIIIYQNFLDVEYTDHTSFNLMKVGQCQEKFGNENYPHSGNLERYLLHNSDVVMMYFKKTFNDINLFHSQNKKNSLKISLKYHR